MLRLVEVRYDVWLEAIKQDGDWSGIEKDISVRHADDLLVFLVDGASKEPCGIFVKENLPHATILREVSLAYDELFPEVFKDYARRKVTTPSLVVVVPPNIGCDNDPADDYLYVAMDRLVDDGGKAYGQVKAKNDKELFLLLDNLLDTHGHLPDEVFVRNSSQTLECEIEDWFRKAGTHIMKQKSFYFKGSL